MTADLSFMASYGARLVDAGFPILPIIPSTKTPGQFRSGRWIGYQDWTKHCDRLTKPFELGIWTHWPEAGIGIACGKIIGLDIDIMDAAVVDRIEALAKVRFGDTTATRVGQAPKKLLVYRVDKPFQSIKRHPLEILAHGSQFVAYAVHPGTGRPYAWPDDSLVDMQLEALPQVTEAQARAFLDEAWELVPTDLRRKTLGRPRNGEYFYGAGSDQRGTYEGVEDALKWIPNDFDYDSWIDIGLAIKAAIGQAGRPLWIAWSRTSPNSGTKEQNTPERKWDGFGEPHSIGAGTIYQHAMDRGWHPPLGMVINGTEADLLAHINDVTSGVHPATAMLTKINGSSEPHLLEKPKLPDLAPDEIVVGAGGLLAEIVAWMCSTAIYPQPFLALGAAITAIGAAAGRRFAGPMDTRTNVYCIGIAESGSGKEHQLTCLNNMFFAANMIEFFAGEEIASGTAIESTMALRAVQLFQIDEFGHFMQSVLNPRATSSHRRDVLVKLTKYTGAATRLVKGTEYANKKERERVDVHDPCVCLYGTTIASPLWEAFGSGALNDGSIARMLFFQSPQNYPDHHKPSAFARDVPTSIIDGLRQIVAGAQADSDFGFTASKSMALDGRRPPALIRIEMDQKAASFADDLACHQVKLKRDHENSEFSPIMARWLEHINRMALIHAISDNPIETAITVADFKWARVLVDYCIETLTGSATHYISDNEHEATLKKVANIIRKHTTLNGNELSRKTQFLSRRERSEAIAQLVESGIITYSRLEGTGGRPGYVVELANS